jgi:hypothetical protein
VVVVVVGDRDKDYCCTDSILRRDCAILVLGKKLPPVKFLVTKAFVSFLLFFLDLHLQICANLVLQVCEFQGDVVLKPACLPAAASVSLRRHYYCFRT